jgi:hypothetical protein
VTGAPTTEQFPTETAGLPHEIRNLGENAKPIRTAFEAVGASRQWS